jgi:HEAT repeat protein
VVATLIRGDPGGTVDLKKRIELLAHPDRGVSSAAENALRAAGGETADSLLRQLPRLPASAQDIAFRLLGEWRDRRLLEYVAAQFKAGDYRLSQYGVDALVALGERPAACLLLEMLANATSAETTKRVQDAIAAMAEAAAEPLLSAYAGKIAIRRTQAELVARVAGIRALEALLAALCDPFRAVRDCAEAGLVKLGSPAVPRLCLLLADSREDVRVRALRVLSRIADKSAAPLVRTHVLRGTRTVRLAAIEALRSLWDSATVETLARAQQASDWRIREAATLAVGSAPMDEIPRCLDLLGQSLRDQVGEVRRASVSALNSLCATAKRPLPPILELIASATADSDETVARYATVSLGNLQQTPQKMLGPQRSSAHEWLPLSRRSTPLEKWIDGFFSLHSPAWRPSPPPDPSTEVTDDVHFSVTCPRIVVPGQTFLIDVWAHLERALTRAHKSRERMRDWMVQTVGPAYLASGVQLRVRMAVPRLEVADENTMSWVGVLSNCNFALAVPASAALESYAGTATIFAAELQLARVSFIIRVGSQRQDCVDDVTSEARTVASAFASYASEDRNEVLAIVQGILKVLPDLDIFLDVASLRSGEHWHDRLEEEIGNRDVFYLFWSSAASRSTHVDWEWRTAMRTRGLEYIEPVPLARPDQVPPPPELEVLHFGEWTRFLRS